MKRKTTGRRALATLVAGAAATLLALGGAVTANAAPGIPENPLILPGQDETDITGTVIVHKHEQGDTAGAPANGLPQTVDSATIGGVEFTATQVVSFEADGTVYNLDLTTNEGWKNAAKLHYNAASDSWVYVADAAADPDGVPATPSFGEPIPRTTGTEEDYATANFNNIDVGLYHFAETYYPSNVTPSVPWVMTVPLTHPEDLNKWLYEINVYPKNSTTEITKAVKDSDGIKLGDPVVWTIRGDIPRTANPAYNDKDNRSVSNLEFLAPSAYRITDQLDGRLQLTSVEVSLVDADGNPLSAPVLAAEDYTVSPTVTVPNPIPGPDNRGENVEVTFTAQGLAKLGLAGSTPGAQVQVVIGTAVAALSNDPVVVDGEEPGIIQNQAFLFPNDSIVEGIPSNVPESKWGDILIRKIDASNGEIVPGAVFSVFKSKEAAEAGNSPIAFGSGGVDKFKTGPDGTVRISGLRYTAFADGEALETTDDRYRTYWLVEVEAPAGYELLAEPIEVIVDSTSQTIETGPVTQIENAPHNGGFELPLTGGMGTAFLTIGGIAILAVVLLVARSRRNDEVSAE